MKWFGRLFQAFNWIVRNEADVMQNTQSNQGILGFSVFGLTIYSTTEYFGLETWNEICPNESNWTDINPKHSTVKECEDAT